MCVSSRLTQEKTQSNRQTNPNQIKPNRTKTQPTTDNRQTDSSPSCRAVSCCLNVSVFPPSDNSHAVMIWSVLITSSCLHILLSKSTSVYWMVYDLCFSTSTALRWTRSLNTYLHVSSSRPRLVPQNPSVIIRFTGK